MPDEVPMPRETPIDIDPERFREIGHRLIDRIAGLLSSMGDRKVTPGLTPADVKAALGADSPMPEEGSDPGELLDRAADLLFEHSLYNGHPRFWGYITSSAAPIGILGDCLAAAVNSNLGSWTLAPMATEIESQTVRWIAELVGYPADCGGVLVSGGNMANFLGFLAARVDRMGQGIRQSGIGGGSGHRLRAYASTETHTWIHKAADLFGLGTDAIRWIATGPDLRIDVPALRRAIEDDLTSGERPFLVIGAAGTVSTGAVDPLDELAALCREHDLWFHVDGAYGSFAAAVPTVREAFRGLALADSVAVDPHKWLYAPLEAGCALVRDPATLRNAFSYHPPYYRFDEDAINYVDYGLQNSRGFRALKVWLALQQIGRSGYARMIGDDIELARQLQLLASSHPELEAGSHSLSVTTFRYVPADLRAGSGTPGTEAYLNELNDELLGRLQRGGEAFVSNAVVGGRYLLRACVVNFRTSSADIRALGEIVVRLGREVDAELRARRGTEVADRRRGPPADAGGPPAAG